MSTRVKLGDVCQIKWGDTSKTKAAYTDEGYPAFSASGRDGYMPHFDHDGPGIVLSAIGAQCGKTWYTDGKWSCIKNTISIRPKPERADGRYIYYQTQTPDLWPVRGAAQPFISQTDARAVEIDLPDLPTQRRIAGILSAYDDLIENNLRRIRILEEMAQSLYREWFVHFRFPGHESVPLIDSPLGPIPEGWEVKKLSRLADQMRRSVPKGELEDPTPYVGLEHIPRQSLALDDWEVVKELGSNKLTFEAGEVLFGKIRPYFHKVSIAPFNGICSADTVVIRAKKSEWRALVISCVFSEAFVAHASATANGAKMPRADWKVLKDYLLVLPPSELLAKFGAVFEDVDHQTRNLIRRNQALRKTRDLLLPKLLSPL